MGQIGKLWRTLREAMGVRQYVVLGTAATIATLIAVIYGALLPSAPVLPAYLVFPLVVVLVLFWWLLVYATTLRNDRDPKIVLAGLDVRRHDRDHGFRVSVRNGSRVALEGFKARLLDVSDDAGALRLGHMVELDGRRRYLDLPIQLYTSERLKERNHGDDWYARPFNLASGESKLVEVFRHSLDTATPISIVDGKNQHALISPPEVTFRCEIVGPGEPLAFSIHYRETSPGQTFEVELQDASGRSLEKRSFSRPSEPDMGVDAVSQR